MATTLSRRELRGVFDELMTLSREISSDLFDVGENVSDACIVEATNTVSRVDLDIKDVEDNWKPTNFYTIEQIRQIVLFGLQLQRNALQALEDASRQRQLDTHREAINAATREFTSNQRISADPFLTAIKQAEALQPTTNNAVIVESSGLKRWVVNNLKAARTVRFKMAAIACARPDTILGAVDALVSAWDAFVAFVKTVAGVIKTAASVVLKIPDALSSLLTILGFVPTAMVLGIGYYAATQTVLKSRDPWRPWRRRSV